MTSEPTAPDTLLKAARATWDKELKDQRQVDLPTVAQKVIEDYPKLVAEKRESLLFGAIVALLKRIARSETEGGSQLSLFGFPAVIAIPVPVDEDGDPEDDDPDIEFQYMRSSKAIWGELVSGSAVRERNVKRAQKRLDAYAAALDTVRETMEGTSLTLAEALDSLRADAAPAEGMTEQPAFDREPVGVA